MSIERLPDSRVRCLICGGLINLNPPGVGPFELARRYRKFLADHRDCTFLMAPALACTVEGCSSTGVGPETLCAAHGGNMEWKKNERHNP